LCKKLTFNYTSIPYKETEIITKIVEGEDIFETTDKVMNAQSYSLNCKTHTRSIGKNINIVNFVHYFTNETLIPIGSNKNSSLLFNNTNSAENYFSLNNHIDLNYLNLWNFVFMMNSAGTHPSIGDAA